MYCGHSSLSLYKENHMAEQVLKVTKSTQICPFSDEFGYKLAYKPVIFCLLEHAHDQILGVG